MQRHFETSPETSKLMSAIRSTDTKIEVALRKRLWAMGARGYRKYAKLPGKPDLYFPRARVVVFIDGCFWHGCPLHYKAPRQNVSYWKEKIQRNIERDKINNGKLQEAGYRVVRYWEHEVIQNLPAIANDIFKMVKG